MLGRTYAIRYEPEPSRRPPASSATDLLNPEWEVGALVSPAAERKFRAIAGRPQRVILVRTRRHRHVRSALAIRARISPGLYGLDKDDNDFLVGLIGKDLYRSPRSSSDEKGRSRRRCISSGSVRFSSAGRSGRAQSKSGALRRSTQNRETRGETLPCDFCEFAF